MFGRFMNKMSEMFLIGMVLAIGALCLGGTIDLIADIKADPAEVACAQKQMDSFRYSLSDSVVCVPYLNRQDTLTVKK